MPNLTLEQMKDMFPSLTETEVLNLKNLLNVEDPVKTEIFTDSYQAPEAIEYPTTEAYVPGSTARYEIDLTDYLVLNSRNYGKNTTIGHRNSDCHIYTTSNNMYFGPGNAAEVYTCQTRFNPYQTAVTYLGDSAHRWHTLYTHHGDYAGNISASGYIYSSSYIRSIAGCIGYYGSAQPNTTNGHVCVNSANYNICWRANSKWYDEDSFGNSNW